MLQSLLAIALPLVFAVTGTADRISPKTALAQVHAKNAVVVDVREDSEVKMGKVADAQVFSASKMGTPEWEKFMAGLPKDKEIYTYCQKGGRADKVAEALRAKGFKASSTGGYHDWVEAGAKSN